MFTTISEVHVLYMYMHDTSAVLSSETRNPGRSYNVHVTSTMWKIKVRHVGQLGEGLPSCQLH